MAPDSQNMLTAIVASVSNKVSLLFHIEHASTLTVIQVDVWTVAAMLNVTYDTVENRLRKIKAEANDLIATATVAGRIDANGKAIKDAVPKAGKGRGAKKEDSDDAGLHCKLSSPVTVAFGSHVLAVKGARVTKNKKKIGKKQKDPQVRGTEMDDGMDEDAARA